MCSMSHILKLASHLIISHKDQGSILLKIGGCIDGRPFRRRVETNLRNKPTTAHTSSISVVEM